MIGGVIVAFFAGCFITMYVVAATVPSGGFLDTAQDKYKQCVADGAPSENCLKNYLLPKQPS